MENVSSFIGSNEEAGVLSWQKLYAYRSDGLLSLARGKVHHKKAHVSWKVGLVPMSKLPINLPGEPGEEMKPPH